MRRLRTPLLLAAALVAWLAPGARAVADEPPPPPKEPPAPAAPAVPDEGRLFDPRFREGKPEDTLRPGGDTPLYRRTLDAFVDLVECGLDLALTAEEEQALRDEIEALWPKAAPEDRRWFTAQGDIRRQVKEDLSKGVNPVLARAGLEGFVRALEIRLNADPDGAWQAIVRKAKVRRDAAFSPGTPPISLADVVAFEDLATFVVAVARNTDERPTLGQREQERPALAKTMADSGALVRRRYDKVNRLWLLVKARWDAADDLARQKFRAAVLRRFLGFAGLPQPDGTVALDLPTYARLAADVRAKAPLFESYQRLLKEPGTLFDIVVDGLGLGAGGIDTALDAETVGLR